MSLRVYKIILALGLLAVIGFVAAPTIFAQTNPNAQLVNLNFPCPTGMSGCAQLTDAANSPNPIGTFLNSFYQIALTISGLLALLMIVAGGVKYTISAGSADQQSDAKDMIISAVYGVALLLGSYLILNTINPKITTLALPGDQYGQVATSSPSVSLPNTECIPNLTSSTVDSATYSQLAHSGITWDGANFRDQSKEASLNCAYRVGYVAGNNDLGIHNDGKYYDENETIPAGATVWQYPYFPSSDTTSSTIATDARCLIYAYQPSNSSSTTMIDLNTGLALCYPHNQQIAINPNANNSASGFGSYDPNALQAAIGCNDQTTCAAKYYYAGYIATPAPNTTALLQCLTDKNILLAVPYYTADQSHPICNYTRGQGTTCSHAVNSCHYGGSFISNDPKAASNQGPLAVDFSVVGQNANNLINGAMVYCSSYLKQGTPGTLSTKDGNEYEARCENSGGQQVPCTDATATHVHMTVVGCNAN